MNKLINNYKHNISLPLTALPVRWAGRPQFPSLLLQLLDLFHSFPHLLFLPLVFFLLSDFGQHLIVFVRELEHVLLGDLNLFASCKSAHQFGVFPNRFSWINGVCDVVSATWAVHGLIGLLGWTSFHHLLTNESKLFLSLLGFFLPGSFFVSLSLDTPSLFEDICERFLRLVCVIACFISFNNFQLDSALIPQRHILTGLSWLEWSPRLVESCAIVLGLLAKLMNATWHLWIRVAKFTHRSIVIEVYLAWGYLELMLGLGSVVKYWAFLLLNSWHLLWSRLLKIRRLSELVRLIVLLRIYL